MTEEKSLGEYRRSTQTVIFFGKDRVDTKRRALDYWYRAPRRAGVTLREFLEHCRMAPSEREITFYPLGR